MDEAVLYGRFTAAEERIAAALGRLLDKVGGRASPRGWFRKLVDEHVRAHARAFDAGHWDRLHPGLDTEARARAEILRACKKAAVAGALASTGASAGEMISLFSDGIATPLVGVPAIVVSLLAEAVYTARLEIDLACDIGSIYGAPFDVEDSADLATLFSLALGLPRKRGGEEQIGATRPQGLIERLMELEDGEMGRRIGRKLLEDSLLSNIVPFVGIPISARWNYVATRKLGATVRRYVRYRRALRKAFVQLRFDTMAEPELLVEGAWLLATLEGEAGREEAMAIALIVDALPAANRSHIASARAFGDDEEGWFDALPLVPKPMHGPLMDVLYLVAAADRWLNPAERRFLQRVGRALEVPVDLPRVEQICRHLALGEALPPGLATAQS